jgi:UDP-N-acetylmuramate dehydrogenase
MTTEVATVSAVVERLRAAGVPVEEHAPLAPLTTYRVGGAAAALATPSDVRQMDDVAAAVGDTGVPVLMVGRGSNMLVADSGFPGIAVSLVACTDNIEVDRAACRVRAGAAVFLPVLARRTAAAGLTGFEWAVGVPGSVGGAVRMNAGGHGSDMAASLVSIRRFDLRSASLVELPASALGLSFRHSGLADHDVVLDAVLQLAPGDVARSEAEIADIVRWRREHQPGGQNCGSVFVNPVPGEVSAGELIDRLGLRGLRVGGAVVSPKHANFIQAEAGATAADVHDLIVLVRRRVADELGVHLRSEVRLVGFAPDEEWPSP